MDFIPRISYGSGPTVIAFTYQPESDPLNEVVRSFAVTSTAANGALQNNQKFLERLRTVKLAFVSSALKTSFDTFFTTWGSRRKSFTYYPHTDVDTDSITATLTDEKIEYNRDLPDGNDDFIYSFKFNLRSVE